ncbi:MAG TPA: response regulator [Pricia sp.]|nr:response regulator [Pricia sp.]
MNTGMRRIFLADDDDDDRQLFQEALAKISDFVNIITFDNGVSLIDQLLKTHEKLPDAIFLDLNMPLMNGEECLADIRNESIFAQVPIIIYSTSLDRAKVEYLYEKGANRYLQKPSSFAHLKSALEKCLGYLDNNTGKDGGILDFVIKY